MGNLTHTVSGDIASFRSAARVPIESLKCHFKPKQSFNGYDKPWPAGGGKNKLNPASWKSSNPYTINGVTFTLNNDGSVLANGKASGSDTTVGFGISVDVDTNFYFCANTSVDGQYEVYIWDATIGARATQWDGTTASLDSRFTTKREVKLIAGHYNVFTLRIVSGATAENVLFQPILMAATETDSTFEPYENICPIEGWDNINMYTTSGDYKIDYISGTTTSYNVTFIVNNNGLITASGTPTSYSSCSYGYIDVEGTETLYGTIFGSLNNITWNKPILINNNGNVITTSLPDSILSSGLDLSQFPNVKRVRIVLKRSINNIPMSGYCSVVIGKNRKITPNTIPITFPVLGKNKFDYNNANIINNKRLDDAGNEVSDASGSYCKTLISVIPNTTYTLSGYTENNVSKRIYYIDKNQNFISRTNAFGGISYTFTTPNNCYYCQIQNREVANAGWETIQLELGDIATTYELYNSNNTVYSGYIDIAAGKLIATHKIIDLSTLTWTPYARTSDGAIDRIKSENISDIMLPKTSSIVSNLIAEQFYSIPMNYDFTDYPNGISIHMSQGYFYKYFDGENYPQGKLVYELKNPICYPISKAELKTFLDQNNIWSNTNDITEVSYQIHDSNMIRERKNVISNTPHIEDSNTTYEHSNIICNTDMIAPLKEAKIYFYPQQVGEYDASPTNVRSITSYTGLDLYIGNNLPNEYQEVEYISGPVARSVINTGVYSNDDSLEFYMKFSFAGTANWDSLFGSWKSENHNACRLLLGSNNTATNFVWASNTRAGSSRSCLIYNNQTMESLINKPITIYLSHARCQLYVEGDDNYRNSNYTREGWTRGDLNSSTTIKINDSGGVTSPLNNNNTRMHTWYYFKIWKHGQLIRNFVPCYRKSDNEVGMYDTVGKQFYSRMTPGYPFSAGPNITNNGTRHISIDWSQIAGPIYGGYIDLINGTLVKTYDSVYINGSTKNTITSVGLSDNGTIGWSVMTDATNKILEANSNNFFTFYIDHLANNNYFSYATMYPYTFQSVSAYPNSIRFCFPTGGDDGVQDATVAGMKSYLSTHPFTLIGPLRATNYETYQLDTQIIKTLKGLNNVWTDLSGKIELKYWTH